MQPPDPDADCKDCPRAVPDEQDLDKYSNSGEYWAPSIESFHDFSEKHYAPVRRIFPGATQSQHRSTEDDELLDDPHYAQEKQKLDCNLARQLRERKFWDETDRRNRQGWRYPEPEYTQEQKAIVEQIKKAEEDRKSARELEQKARENRKAAKKNSGAAAMTGETKSNAIDSQSKDAPKYSQGKAIGTVLKPKDPADEDPKTPEALAKVKQHEIDIKEALQSAIGSPIGDTGKAEELLSKEDDSENTPKQPPKVDALEETPVEPVSLLEDDPERKDLEPVETPKETPAEPVVLQEGEPPKETPPEKVTPEETVVGPLEDQAPALADEDNNGTGSGTTPVDNSTAAAGSNALPALVSWQDVMRNPSAIQPVGTTFPPNNASILESHGRMQQALQELLRRKDKTVMIVFIGEKDEPVADVEMEDDLDDEEDRDLQMALAMSMEKDDDVVTLEDEDVGHLFFLFGYC